MNKSTALLYFWQRRRLNRHVYQLGAGILDKRNIHEVLTRIHGLPDERCGRAKAWT